VLVRSAAEHAEEYCNAGDSERNVGTPETAGEAVPGASDSSEKDHAVRSVHAPVTSFVAADFESTDDSDHREGDGGRLQTNGVARLKDLACLTDMELKAEVSFHNSRLQELQGEMLRRMNEKRPEATSENRSSVSNRGHLREFV
jgi:hypothetical protein